MPTPDLGWLAAVRAERLARQAEQSFGAPPVVAVLGAQQVEWLGRAGWRVAGHLHGALGQGPWPTYRAAEDVLLDPGIDAVLLQTGTPGVPADAADLLPELAAAGLHLLVDGVDRLDPVACRSAVAAAQEAGVEHVVLLTTRFAPGLTAAEAELARLGRPWARQVVLPSWRGDDRDLVELLDVALRLAGPAVAVRAATPGATDLPADRLTDGTPVALALLCESGVTVLVGRRGPGAVSQDLVRIAGPDGAGLLVRASSATRLDGSPLLAEHTPQVPADDRQVGPEREWLPGPAAVYVGEDPDDARVAVAARLARRLTHDDDGWLVDRGPGQPAPASLRDAVTLLAVLDALRRSQTDDAWVELA